MSLIKKLGIVGTLTLSSLANADLKFPDSGVWSQPRIYNESSEVENYSSIPLGEYIFKTRLEEVAGIQTTGSLLAEISGPENYSNLWEEITLSANAESYRQWTQEFSTPGDYNISFTLNNNQKIEREFTIIPEPSSIFLWSLPALQMFRKRK
jgi:hypothetical protein